MSTLLLDRSQVPAPAPVRPFSFPAVSRSKLKNGIPLVFSETEGLPVVTFSLLLPGGALREAPEQSGLASLTASLLESGTSRLSAAEIAERVEDLGIRLSVGTSWEMSHADFTVLSSKAREAAALIAELVSDPIFPDEEVERVRSQQLAGILQKRADPRGLANEVVGRYIFSPDSPFSRALSGTPETVKTLEREQIRRFHAAGFTPSGSSLVVAGNLPQDELYWLADEAFGGGSGVEPTEISCPTEPRSRQVQVVVVDRPGAVQSELRVGHVGVARNSPDYFALVVMNTILGGAFSSRLNLNLREKNGFTYGASSSFIMRRRPGPFLISTAIQTEVTGAAIRETLSELDRIRSSTVSSAELADATQYVAGTFPLRLQTTDGVASSLVEIVVHGLDDRYFDSFAERVLSVSAEEVEAVASKYIRPDELTILVAGDAEKVVPQLGELNLGQVEVVKADEL